MSSEAILTVLVYDIASDRTRRRVHGLLREYGAPVQESAFEARLTVAERTSLLGKVRKLLDPETDRFCLYPVPSDLEKRIEAVGRPRPVVESPAFFIV